MHAPTALITLARTIPRKSKIVHSTDIKAEHPQNTNGTKIANRKQLTLLPIETYREDGQEAVTSRVMMTDGVWLYMKTRINGQDEK